MNQSETGEDSGGSVHPCKISALCANIVWRNRTDDGRLAQPIHRGFIRERGGYGIIQTSCGEPRDEERVRRGHFALLKQPQVSKGRHVLRRTRQGTENCAGRALSHPCFPYGPWLASAENMGGGGTPAFVSKKTRGENGMGVSSLQLNKVLETDRKVREI